MKPADQLKVIALAFVSIIVMIGVITAVSIKTTEAVASHGGGHGTETHSTEGEHAAPAEANHSTPGAEHGSEAKPAEQSHEAAPAEHGTESKPAEHSSESKPAEHASETKTGEHATEAKPAADAAHSADKGETHTATASGGNVEAGAKVFMTKTCSTCHTATKVKAAGTIGPKLDGLGATAAKREAGMSAEDYIKQSIEDPNAFVVEGFTKGLMPPLRSTMSDQEFKDLVAFLGSL